MLSADWAVWAAENLLRGVSRDEVARALQRHDVDDALCSRALDEIERSPVFHAARRIAVAHRRDALLRRLLIEHAEIAPHPGTLPRAPYPDAESFYARYYATLTPVILTGMMLGWPCLESWSPQALAARFGEVMVSAVYGREGVEDYDMRTPSLSQEVPLARFVEDVLKAGASNDLYLVANGRNIDRPELCPLWDDLRMDDALFDPARREGAAALWLGPQGTVTPLHHDTANIMLFQVFGEKRVSLAAPWEPGLEGTRRGVYSSLDPEALDPDAREPRFWRGVLRPGDALFIPAGWWHHLRALSVSVSFGVTNFTRDNHFNWFRPGEVR